MSNSHSETPRACHWAARYRTSKIEGEREARERKSFIRARRASKREAINNTPYNHGQARKRETEIFLGGRWRRSSELDVDSNVGVFVPVRDDHFAVLFLNQSDDVFNDAALFV
jgi:hypothetical protein